MKKIKITNKQEAEEFLKDRGYTSQEIIDLKQTTNNKELAKMLKTSPNKIQTLLKAIGVDYNTNQWDKFDLVRTKATQVRNKQENKVFSLSDKELLRIAAESNYDLRLMAKKLGVYQTIVSCKLEDAGIDLSELMAQKKKKDAENKIRTWENSQKEEIRLKLAVNVPVHVIKEQCRESAVKHDISKRTANRFLDSYFDQMPRNHATDPAEIAVAANLRRMKRSFSDVKVSRFFRSVSLPEPLLRSVFPDLIIGISFDRYLKSMNCNNNPRVDYRNLWDWLVEHKELILTFLHLHKDDPVRETLENRIREFDYVRPLPDCDLSEAIVESSDSFALSWYLLQDGLTMTSSERLSFRRYLDFYRSVQDRPLNNETCEVLNDRKASILMGCPVDATGFEDAWAYWKMESDPIVMEELLEKCRTTTVNQILQSVPFFRRTTLFYSDALSDFKNRILQIRKTENVDEFRKYNPEEFSELINFIDGRRTINNTEVVSFCKTKKSLPLNRVLQILDSLNVEIDKVDHSSVFENNMEKLLDGMGVYFLKNQRILRKDSVRGSKEIDFYLPDLNLGIEVSPTYTHNSTYGWNYDPLRARKATYHQEKTLLAEGMGIDLITLYEKDLTEPNWSAITVPFIMFKVMGPTQLIYARETELQVIPSRTAREFLDFYHFQGFIPSKWHLGWIHKKSGELLGVASIDVFTNAQNKPIGRFALELKRMCFLPDIMIPFGLSKLVKDLKDVIDDNRVCKADSLYSYSRLDMGGGDSYRKAGFSLVRTTVPSLRFINPTDPYDGYSWMAATPWSAKSGIISKVIGSCEMSKDEAIVFMEEKMPRRTGNGFGYVKVYDSGNRLWCRKI